MRAQGPFTPPPPAGPAIDRLATELRDERAKREAAEAACAEMRALLVDIASAGGPEAGAIAAERAAELLVKTDLGKGWVSPDELEEMAKFFNHKAASARAAGEEEEADAYDGAANHVRCTFPSG